MLVQPDRRKKIIDLISLIRMLRSLRRNDLMSGKFDRVIYWAEIKIWEGLEEMMDEEK